MKTNKNKQNKKNKNSTSKVSHKGGKAPGVGCDDWLGSFLFLSLDGDKVKFSLPPNAKSMSFNRAGIEVIAKDLNQWLTSGTLSHTQESLQGITLAPLIEVVNLPENRRKFVKIARDQSPSSSRA